MADTTPRKSVALDRTVTREEFARAAEAIGFTRHEIRPADSSGRAYEEVWSTPDRITAVNYLEDPLVGVTYLMLRGHDVEHYATQFAFRIAAIDGGHAFELAAGAGSAQNATWGLGLLAVTHLEPDSDVIAFMTSVAENSPEPTVRFAAVRAMAYRGWRDFVPVLERVAAHDADAQVRALSERVLPHVRDDDFT